jgi:serine/threonine protein kinase
MKDSLVYTIAGDIEKFEGPAGCPPVFQKMFDVSKSEYAIVSHLQGRPPHPNIVKIYEVTDTHWDAELLDVDIDTKDPRIKEQMKAAKNHLQSIGIIYMDWKYDNIGVDTYGTYKLFDFNMSGMWVDKRWVVKPEEGWNYNTAVNAGITYPIAIDNYAFENTIVYSTSTNTLDVYITPDLDTTTW